jgi:Skp family chaperone for outer membrane proteins
MKTSALVVMAVFLISAAVPVFAQTAQEQQQCAISANTCLNKAEVVEKRMKKMKADIKKGTTYSPEEMKTLEQKLQDVMDQMDKMGVKK